MIVSWVTNHPGEIMNVFTEEMMFDLIPEEWVRFYKE